MTITRRYDTVTYADETGKDQRAPVVVAVGPDGQPTGAVQIVARDVQILDGLSLAGTWEALPADDLRMGLTLRNDSDAQMYFNLGQPAGDGIGYPMDARRGYSFEALGMIPRQAVNMWCGTSNKRWVAMYTTRDSDIA